MVWNYQLARFCCTKLQENPVVVAQMGKETSANHVSNQVNAVERRLSCRVAIFDSSTYITDTVWVIDSTYVASAVECTNLPVAVPRTV